MSVHQTQPDDLPDAPPGQHAQDAQKFRRVLHRMIDVGVELVDQLPRTPTPDIPTPAVKAQIAEAYERITRAVRRSIMLAQNVAAWAQSDPAIQRVAARKRAIREVEDNIQCTARRPTDAEPLHAELLERLDQPEFEEEIGNRPIADIITDICRDLGLAASPGTRPWKRRTPADIETLRARAAQPAPARPPPPNRDPANAVAHLRAVAPTIPDG